MPLPVSPDPMRAHHAYRREQPFRARLRGRPGSRWNRLRRVLGWWLAEVGLRLTLIDRARGRRRYRAPRLPCRAPSCACLI